MGGRLPEDLGKGEEENGGRKQGEGSGGEQGGTCSSLLVQEGGRAIKPLEGADGVVIPDGPPRLRFQDASRRITVTTA